MNRLRLKGKIVEKGLTHKDIAAKGVWNCALCTVSQKINGVRPIYLDEANKLAKLLSLTPQEYYEIFFGQEIA
ncbi:MAG: XRE family transcriptional regulator [Clostridiaceae bacterium]|nr:XRE family transcriptional regulator [Clostridiaceae bacterium]